MSLLQYQHYDRPTVGRVKRALRFSTVEGMAYGAFLGLGDHFIIAFAVALKTSSLQIGVLASLPGFLASLAQLYDAELVRLFRSRKAVILTSALLQGLMFLPMLVLAFVPLGSPGWWLVFFATLYSIFGALVSPAWGSLMAEVVPEALRGRYFSMRGRLSTLATVVTFLLAGVFLNLLAYQDLWGFAVLFGAAVLARLLSSALLGQLYELPQPQVQGGARSERVAVTPGSASLGRYLLFLFAMSFAVNIASPYFPVYQLRDLKMSYMTFAVLETLSSLATLLAITHWGQAADRAGNRKMLVLASFLIPFVPLLWLASANVYYLGLVQAFSGMAWAGFNLCSVNYLYDASAPMNRTRYLTYFNAGNGLAAGAGALLGGYLAPHLPAFQGYQILTLFLISGVLRLLVSLVLLPGVKEVRKVSDLPAAQLFHILIGGRPVNPRISHSPHFNYYYRETVRGKRLREVQRRQRLIEIARRDRDKTRQG